MLRIIPVLTEYKIDPQHLIEKFREGWNPYNDSKWLEFKKDFSRVNKLQDEDHPIRISIKNSMFSCKLKWTDKTLWNGVKSTISSKLWWTYADLARVMYLSDTTISDRKLSIELIKQIPVLNKYKISRSPIQRMLGLLRNGWIPTTDPNWLRLKEEFKLETT
jgi:hypothetical protein